MDCCRFTEQMTRIIPSFAGFTEFTTSIPKMYWDVKSQEQRILGLCRMLDKVICYADMLGENVDEIAKTLKDIEDGKLDPMIEAAIEAWFEDNQPQIATDIAALQAALPIADFDADNTVKDAIDMIGNDVTAVENAIGEGFDSTNTIASVIERIEKYTHSFPEFRCIARFNAGKEGVDGLEGVQAGCMFEFNNVLYWAQIMQSSTLNKDRLVIVNAESNTVVSDTEMELGHGYTLSYNPNTKMLMTENSEVSPMELILIDVSNIATPFISSTISVPVGMHFDNPCYYDVENNYIAGFGDLHTIVVCDFSFNVIKTMTTDFYNTFWFGQGFVFQTVQYLPDTHKFVIGISGDGIIFADENEDNTVTMYDYLPLKRNYGCLYMRELEFANVYDNKVYIATGDLIDQMVLPALFVWDMVNGTIGADRTIATAYQANRTYSIDYANTDIIPDGGTTFKFAMDAINAYRLSDQQGRLYLDFASDYPYRVVTAGAKCRIYTTSNTDVSINGIYINEGDVQLTGTHLTIVPSQVITVAGTPRYIGIYCYNSHIWIQTSWATLNNVDSVANPILLYTEHSSIDAMQGAGTSTEANYFRFSEVNTISTARLNPEVMQECAITLTSNLP